MPREIFQFFCINSKFLSSQISWDITPSAPKRGATFDSPVVHLTNTIWWTLQWWSGSFFQSRWRTFVTCSISSYNELTFWPVFAVDDDEQVLLELTYPEITNVVPVKPETPANGNSNGIRTQSVQFSLQTIRGDFVFRSSNAEDIQELIAFFLDGLKRKSKYCVATQDYKVKIQRFSDISSFR